MIASIPSATLLGVDGLSVAVEVHVSSGLPGFTLVGLPDSAVKESRERVRAALLSSDLPWQVKRVTVNLAPAELRKSGAGLDLPIAIAYLVASGELDPGVVDGLGFVGELGLDGSVRRVPGMVPLADAIDARALVVPLESVHEAGLAGPADVRGVSNLRQLVDALRGDAPWPHPPPATRPGTAPAPEPDMADVRGQPLGREAIEVAAAGGHHLLLAGPPGAGKTLLARRLPGLLPRLDRSAALEVSKIHSAAGLPLPADGLLTAPPFRAPHHGASAVSLIGGGSTTMRPGEISLANRGVLFLDEFGEFAASVLDSLRQPLEEGVVRVSRAKGSVVYPAKFLLVAAMNPCRCGGSGGSGPCKCKEYERHRATRKVSGPLLDRFDLRVTVTRPDPYDLLGGPPGEPTAVVAARVAAARAVAMDRARCCNADIPGPFLDEIAPLTPGARRLLEHRLRRGSLSARGLHRVRRVARTLADLQPEPPDVLDESHVAAALELRSVPDTLELAS